MLKPYAFWNIAGETTIIRGLIIFSISNLIETLDHLNYFDHLDHSKNDFQNW